MVKPYLMLIKDLAIVKDDAVKITFKNTTSWPQIVACLVKMKANECWQATDNKQVTIWWD